VAQFEDTKSPLGDPAGPPDIDGSAYRALFENTSDAIFHIRKNMIIDCNIKAIKMLKCNREHVIGRDFNEFLPLVQAGGWNSKDMLINKMKESALSGPQFFKQQRLRHDGTSFDAEVSLSRIIIGGEWLFQEIVRDAKDKTFFYEGTIEDITEKKKVANRLRQLNEFNKAIIDHAPVAIFTLDKNGVFTSINPALAALSGLAKEAETKLIGFNWLKDPYTIQCGLARHIEAGLEGEPFQLWDFPFMTYRGDRNNFIDFKGVPLKDKNGGIEGLLCIIEETTDRVKTRAKLMQEAKVATIGRLAAGIAHELNNPLGTLVAYSERAHSCLESLPKLADVERLKGYLNIIEEEAFRCKGVTTDILSLLQKEGLEITEIDIGELLDGVIERLGTEKIRITREPALAAPLILGDANALRQVFVNLITNAQDAVEGRADAAIWIRTMPMEDHVLVEIEDNGTGIPDSIADKIFEPFFTTKESKSGIGLGLTLCHDLMQDMGGATSMVSTPGHGTTFSLLFQRPGAR
jgi:PAS domain S-box-containing protein